MYRYFIWPIAAATLGIILWSGMYPGGAWGFFLKGNDKTYIPALLLPIPGLLVGLGIGWCAARPWRVTAKTDPDAAAASIQPTALLIPIIVVMMLGALLGASVLSGLMNAISGSLVFIFGSLTVFVAAYALEAIRRDEGVALESHWGGMGGGMGGWRLTTAGVLGLLFAALTSATIMVAIVEPKTLVQKAAEPPPKTEPAEPGTDAADPKGLGETKPKSPSETAPGKTPDGKPGDRAAPVADLKKIPLARLEKLAKAGDVDAIEELHRRTTEQ